MTARAIMFQGTGSDVGKSLIVAGLARAFARRGLRVRPFKPQNMSNNAGVAADGGEIGRAQLLQARAAGIAPSVDMNPVLLKPEAETGAQIVLRGEVLGRASARRYQTMKGELLEPVLESFERLSADADLVLIEGAGSPAEINLRQGDIANMGFAEAAGVPVVLIGDIDRGGVIAQIVGTMAVLAAADRDRIQGFLVNKFRGDPALFEAGLAMITERTGLASFGLVPWFAEAGALPAEDAMGLEAAGPKTSSAPICIAVPRFSRIANFDDLDPLIAEPDVSVEIVPPGRALPGDADLVILPGSKATIADLEAFRAEGWDIDLKAHLRRGGQVLGICAGFQMLGRTIADPEGLEGPARTVAGLGLLEMTTELRPAKRLGTVRGRDRASGEAVYGYEMHMGETRGAALRRPLFEFESGPDGAVSEDGKISGCYLHGLFAADAFRHRFLAGLRARAASGVAYESVIEATLDGLAEHLEAAADLDALWALGAQRYSQTQKNVASVKRPAACR